MNGGVQRHTAEEPRRRIAEAIGGHGVSRFVHRQRKDEDAKRDEDGDEVDVAEQGAQRTTELSCISPIAPADRPSYRVADPLGGVPS